MARKRERMYVLEGRLSVHQMPRRPAAISFDVARGLLPDGSAYRLSAAMGAQAVILERDGHPPRVVYLNDLVVAIVGAWEGA